MPTRLQKQTGPACPDCGCEHGETIRSDVRRRYQRDGAGLRLEEEVTFLRRVCLHCGRQFTVRAEDTNGQLPDAELVDLQVLRCPHCNSRSTRVTSTLRGGKRYHKCLNCRLTFKSREVG